MIPVCQVRNKSMHSPNPLILALHLPLNDIACNNGSTITSRLSPSNGD